MAVKHKKKVDLKTKTHPLVTAFLILVSLIQVFPLYWMFTFSLKDNKEIFGANTIGLPQVWRWSNYEQVFSKANMGVYLMNSVIITALTIFFTLLLSAMATYAIVRMKWKLSKFVYNTFLIGMMLSIHAVLLPLYLNLQPIMSTRWVLILPYTAFAMPQAILLMVGSLEALPKEMEEAAFIDGANIYRIFFMIILPMLMPILSTVAILTFLSSWNEMMLAVTFISIDKLKTVTVGVNDMVGKYSTKWGIIGAGLTAATVPTLVMYALLSKNVTKSLAMGAVKG
ncbi:MAG: carbohydrate ABC transporter permease [Clostridia bacterium]|nr:carbohydrate ABC transporter permease [Clostridia bacterium]